MTKEQDTQIPSKPVVRVVAVILLLLSLTVLYVAIIKFEALGTGFAMTAILGSLGSAMCSLTALKTGKPDWILLDLIFPM